MIQLEQQLELVRVVYCALCGVEDLQLLVHVRLTSTCDVEEYRIDALPCLRLLYSRGHSRLLCLIEGGSDLPDLVAAVVQFGDLDGDVDLLTGAEPLHNLWQVFVGQSESFCTEPDQPPDKVGAEPNRND